MVPLMRASIVVLNYNYACFVGEAIASALRQSYADLEVVVVDNGSTDDSLEVIQAYGDRVRVVRQATNIGQGQGYNLGFEAARGDWIVWLDADDLLDDDAIANCMALVQPDTAKVQFPLRLVDAQGARLGGSVPFLCHQGDVVPIIRRFGHYAGPPGSGNFYRRLAIAPYFPVAPGDWPINTDTVPFVTALFHGRVVDAGRPLGCYRIHSNPLGDVPGYMGNFGLSMGSAVRLSVSSRDQTLALLRERSGIEVPGPFLTLPTHVRLRITSWRCARALHPFPEDTPARLWRLMRDSLRECPGYTALERLLMRLWTAGMLFLPAPFANVLLSARRSNPFWAALIRRSGRAET